MPVLPTPESNNVVLRMIYPQEGQIVGSTAWVQFRIDGYSLGADSQFERANEVSRSNLGQTVHVIIDNNPYFPINEPALDPFNDGGYYYDISYKFEIPYPLSEGMHTLRMFPARSYGESLKGDNTFQAISFYVGKKTKNPQMNLSKPYITYNEPSNEISLVEGTPVLLDFYVSNAELSSDGYKVRLTIDNKVNRMLTSWQPYYIYGLKKGKHTIRLELIDQKDKKVEGLFNDVQRLITIH